MMLIFPVRKVFVILLALLSLIGMSAVAGDPPASSETQATTTGNEAAETAGSNAPVVIKKDNPSHDRLAALKGGQPRGISALRQDRAVKGNPYAYYQKRRDANRNTKRRATIKDR